MQSCWTGVNFTFARWLYVHYSAGEDRNSEDPRSSARLCLNLLLMSPWSHLSRRLLPSSSLFLSVNSTVAPFNHETVLLPLFSALTHLFFSNSQLLSAGDTRASPNLLRLPQLTYDPFTPCCLFTSPQPLSLIFATTGTCTYGIGVSAAHAGPASSTQFSQKLGQRSFEGHSAVKWLLSA